LPTKTRQAERLPYNVDLIVLAFGPYRRRRFIAKFAMPNFPAGSGNMLAHSN